MKQQQTITFENAAAKANVMCVFAPKQAAKFKQVSDLELIIPANLGGFDMNYLRHCAATGNRGKCTIK